MDRSGYYWALPGLVAASLLLVTVPARGKEIQHVLRDGESLAALADHFYGSRWKAVYILGRNQLASSKEAKAGMRLLIPACWIYRVRRGDSPTKIAKKYLGDAERFTVMMSMNGLDKDQEIKVGQELLMPFHITHPVQRGDSLSGIAKRFFGTTRKANLLRDYNGDSSDLHPDDKLIVPIFDRAALDLNKKSPPPAPNTKAPEPPRPAARAPDPELKAETGKEPEEPTAAEETETDEAPAPSPAAVSRKAELAEAVAAYSAGEFAAATEQLEAVLETAADNGLPPGELAVTLRYLGFCAVASADPEMAREYFHQWLVIEPDAKLDLVAISPKIIAIFEEAVAEKRDEPRAD